MNQTIYVPRSAVILICGPSCTGKSTLAKHIIEACPIKSKFWLSTDDIMEEYLEAQPDAAKRVLNSMIANHGMVRDPELDLFMAKKFAEALFSKTLVVIDGIYVQSEAVANLIEMSAHARGPSPFLLVKMNPSEQQHHSFYEARDVRRKLVWSAVEAELFQFQEVLQTDYAQKFFWAQQYTMDDPCNVTIRFLD